MTHSTGTVDLNRTITDDEVKALVTIETAERLALQAELALVNGDVGRARRLLAALVDTTTTRTATAIKSMALSDQVADATRANLRTVADRMAQEAVMTDEVEHDDECGEDIRHTGACRHGKAF